MPVSDCQSSQFPSTGSKRAAHLVGVCGSGMKALAEVLIDRGWRVSGSDLQADSPAGQTLRRRGMHISGNHSASNVPTDVELLVYSSAVKAENPEREVIRLHRSNRTAGGKPFASFAYHEMLGELMRESIGISIAGTHGKSTTTALTGAILTDAGLQPTVVVGAEVCGRDANGWSGKGPHLVAESCEYHRHFLCLQPKFATILGIEEDHFDCFKDVTETIAAFRDFALQLPADGLMVIPADSENCLRACDQIGAQVETIGVNDCVTGAGGYTRCPGELSGAGQREGEAPAEPIGLNDVNCLSGSAGASRSHNPGLSEISPTLVNPYRADWQAVNIRKIPLGHRFDIFHHGQRFCSTALRIPGQHHILNALAAAALCHRAGAAPEQIADGIERFRGIRRRFEVRDDWLEATVVDDYAHHPTAIQATLRTAREEFGDRRIVCVFQPHQVSRTLGLLPDFARSFAEADQVIIVPVYGARETFQRELVDVSQRLAKMIAANGVAAGFGGSLDQTRASLEDTLRPGDVLLTLGAGDIDRIHHALNCRLS